MEYFTTAEPLEKEKILDVFKDVLTLTQLLVAPFGLPNDTIDILGDFVARRDYKIMHRCWEDFIARKIYSLKGVSDDRVAASLQYYLEKQQDQEVMDAMKINENAASMLLTTKTVVQLPGDSCVDLEDLACNAFLGVVSAWKQLEDEVAKGLLKSKSDCKLSKIDVNAIHPSDIGYIVSFMTTPTIKGLLDSIRNIPCLGAANSTTDLSYEQYIALIDIYIGAGHVTPRVKKLLSSIDSLLSDYDLSTANSRPSVLYGDVEGGVAIMLRRLRAFGSHDGLCQQYSSIACNGSEKSSIRLSDGQYSAFCHPVIASIVRLEEVLRVSVVRDDFNEATKHLENVYNLNMELLSVYNTIVKKRYSNGFGELKSDQELQEEEESMGDMHPDTVKETLLDVIISVDESISKFNGLTSALKDLGNSSLILNLNCHSTCDSVCVSQFCASGRILAAFLIERASCRIKTEEIEEALEDINRALEIDPKLASCYKNRFKIYSRMAMAKLEDERLRQMEVADNCDGSESDDDNNEPNSNSFLMKSAYDALAAFILDGSTNLLLAGAAEDATREACREEAKEYFWDRIDNDESDEDATDDSDDEAKGKSSCVEDRSSSKEQRGRISTLLQESCDENNDSLLKTIVSSTTLPRSWLINSYMTLFAPLDVAFDISIDYITSARGYVEDGLGEDVNIPFHHLIDENENENKAPMEGDADAFNLICIVANFLMKCKIAGHTESTETFSKNITPLHTESDNIISLVNPSENCENNEHHQSEICSDCSKVEVWHMDSADDIIHEVISSRHNDTPPELLMSGRILTSRVDEEKNMQCVVQSSVESLRIDNDVGDDETHIPKVDMAASTPFNESSGFIEAFRIISSSASSALTGAIFNWSYCGESDDATGKQILGDTDAAITTPQFRISVELLPSLMASVDQSSDEVELDSYDINLRSVSRRLRSRLLSLCGSISYMCGDAMGGYECMKASILLDDNMLDSRLKVGSILLEMDELDKAEAQLMEAKHRQCWEDDICLNLHIAELYLHRMEYSSAVRLLRSTSRRLDFLMQGWEGLISEKHVAEHIGPNVISLLGVAEFRVAPDTPTKALNVLQNGINTFPGNVSLHVSYGEILGQSGDPAGALKSYAKASNIEPNHPLPFLNASRVYQQLNQHQLCKVHMAKALDLDRSLSLTLVDIAQFKLHEKRFAFHGDGSSPEQVAHNHDILDDMSSEAILNAALDVSRHVSEVIDVYTARQIARFYARLGESGLAPVFM